MSRDRSEARQRLLKATESEVFAEEALYQPSGFSSEGPTERRQRLAEARVVREECRILYERLLNEYLDES